MAALVFLVLLLRPAGEDDGGRLDVPAFAGMDEVDRSQRLGVPGQEVIEGVQLGIRQGIDGCPLAGSEGEIGNVQYRKGIGEVLIVEGVIAVIARDFRVGDFVLVIDVFPGDVAIVAPAEAHRLGDLLAPRGVGIGFVDLRMIPRIELVVVGIGVFEQGIPG